MGAVTVNNPNARYPHVHVVIRIDSAEGLETTPDFDEVVVTSVFDTREEAAAEVDRLNRLGEQRGSRSRYIIRVGRLKSPPREMEPHFDDE